MKKFPLWVLEACGRGYYYDTFEECLEEREAMIKSGDYVEEEFLIYFDSELLRDIIK